MLFKVTDKFLERYPILYDLTSKGLFDTIITYIVDWRFRKSIDLKSWLKPQLLFSKSFRDYADTIKVSSGSSYDDIVLACLLKVKKDIKYVKDEVSWDVNEKWQTIEETLQLRSGDCEDGAIFLYALCRYKGVPSNRLYLCCGDVDGGGHCWLAYKPNNYPLSFVFLDWCYNVISSKVGSRPYFNIIGKEIIEYYYNEVVKKNSLYFKIWFLFNEDVASFSNDFNSIDAFNKMQGL